MDPSDIEFPSDFAKQIERLDLNDAGPQFALPASQFLRVKAADNIARRGIKKLINPANAEVIIPHLPSPDERTHCALRGDFVLCDLIPAVIHARGHCPDLRIATLSMSIGNADTLATLIERGKVEKLTITCSHYFREVDKTTVYRQVAARLEGLASLIITRCHAKVICLPTASGDAFVIEGSANLRSSDNTEQMVIFNDPDLLAWHCDWLNQLTPHP
jgi:hypothetical protein